MRGVSLPRPGRCPGLSALPRRKEKKGAPKASLGLEVLVPLAAVPAAAPMAPEPSLFSSWPSLFSGVAHVAVIAAVVLLRDSDRDRPETAADAGTDYPGACPRRREGRRETCPCSCDPGAIADRFSRRSDSRIAGQPGGGRKHAAGSAGARGRFGNPAASRCCRKTDHDRRGCCPAGRRAKGQHADGGDAYAGATADCAAAAAQDSFQRQRRLLPRRSGDPRKRPRRRPRLRRATSRGSCRRRGESGRRSCRGARCRPGGSRAGRQPVAGRARRGASALQAAQAQQAAAQQALADAQAAAAALAAGNAAKDLTAQQLAAAQAQAQAAVDAANTALANANAAAAAQQSASDTAAAATAQHDQDAAAAARRKRHRRAGGRRRRLPRRRMPPPRPRAASDAAPLAHRALPTMLRMPSRPRMPQMRPHKQRRPTRSRSPMLRLRLRPMRL